MCINIVCFIIRFNYRAALEANLSKPAYVMSVFNDSVMHGAEGVSTTISLPPFEGDLIV